MDLVISTPDDFSLLETVSAHGWRRLLPFRWDEDTQTLLRPEAFADGRVVMLEIRAVGGEVLVHTNRDCDLEEVTARVKAMLQLNLPLDAFHAYCRTHPTLAHLAEHRRGRLLRCSTLWEDTVKVIATTNTTWAQTIAMTGRLVAEFGSEGQAFPTPVQIAAVTPEEFAAKARMGYRAAYVHSIATAICEGALDLEAWQTQDIPAEDLRKRLLSLPGIGPYGAACLMLYLGKPAHVNSDSVARAALSQELGHPVTDKEVHAFFDPHGEWRGLVYNLYPWSEAAA